MLGQCCQLVRSLDYLQDFRASAEWNDSMEPAVSGLVYITRACLLGKGLGMQQGSPLPSSAAVSPKKGSPTQWADGDETELSLQPAPATSLRPGRPGQSWLPCQL